MYPGKYAATDPDRVAARLLGSDTTLTYGQLEDRSVRLSNVLRGAGLGRGDVVALLTDNDLRAFEVFWAALRTGCYITAINHNLAPDEVAYIINDSGAVALVASASTAQTATATVARTSGVRLLLAFGGPVPGFGSYDDVLASASSVTPADQPHGMPMLYSSGTTGRPKGVRPALPDSQITDGGDPMMALVGTSFGLGDDCIYLSPAPLYHAAPLRWCAAVQANGGMVIVQRRFDPADSLAAIEEYHVTHAQFVPTMFVRMLQMPDGERAAYDVSSMRLAVHAAAPCPVEVKQKMIDWWGPILVEYYGATEGNTMTVIDSATWLKKPGTVGKPAIGIIHVCDDDGKELPAGQAGLVYVEREGVVFTYHNDPEKTRASQHPDHENWTTLGDIGHVDEDGFLFLTDRAAFMIISGGVNIYPQETENALALHPAVHDVAVIGLPHPEMGEYVAAYVQPTVGVATGPELEEEIISFVRSRIASYKAPRVVRFVDDLPRTDTGKLVKGELKKRVLAEGAILAT